MPYKVLDAPDLQDDFYLNLIDWSHQNLLAVGLGPSVYLWNAGTSEVSLLVIHYTTTLKSIARVCVFLSKSIAYLFYVEMMSLILLNVF